MRSILAKETKIKRREHIRIDGAWKELPNWGENVAGTLRMCELMQLSHLQGPDSLLKM